MYTLGQLAQLFIFALHVRYCDVTTESWNIGTNRCGSSLVGASEAPATFERTLSTSWLTD
jgi:hypothetical protein